MTTITFPKVGDTLKNGATLLAIKALEEPHQAIVLGFFRNEYVTWLYTAETGSCHYGHYHQDDLLDAAADFKKRD